MRTLAAAVSFAAIQEGLAANRRPSYYDVIADKIEAEPGLLDIPLANIERWLARGHSAPHRLEQWRALIQEAKADDLGLRRFLFILRDKSEDATHLRSFDPFHGILTRTERRKIIQQCAFSH